MTGTWFYTFSNQVTAPPTSNQIRFDAEAPYQTVTRIWATLHTTDGLDAYVGLMNIPIGSTLYVQDKNDHALSAIFTLVSAPVDATTYIEWPVTWLESRTALNNAQAIAVVIQTPAAPGPTPEPPDTVPDLDFARVTLPPLWTVDQAKVHLRVTDTAHDVDIQQKLTTAQEAILSYLNWAADPMWTAETAPAAVTHAIHLLTAYYYEDRGDRDLPNPWPKIYDLLAAYRDPTLA